MLAVENIKAVAIQDCQLDLVIFILKQAKKERTVKQIRLTTKGRSIVQLNLNTPERLG